MVRKIEKAVEIPRLKSEFAHKRDSVLLLSGDDKAVFRGLRHEELQGFAVKGFLRIIDSKVNKRLGGVFIGQETGDERSVKSIIGVIVAIEV